jgi:cytochrome oxidase Cu insertion factor (SCO1/SenC/PrrC family)
MRWRRASWLLIPIVVIGVLAGILIPRGGSPEPALAGAVLPQRPAPQLALTDQFGRRVTLAQLHGRPVLLTFLDARCTTLCPLVAETIRRNLAELGQAAGNVAIVVVSTDPEGDTPSEVRAFSRKHGMLHRWLYLTGSRKVLTPIWKSYFIYAAPPNAPAAIRNDHSSGTYLIDAQGWERVFMGGDPDDATLRRDLLILSGLPVSFRGVAGVPAPQIGHPAPSFTLATLAMQELPLSSLRGKVVLLNFWATWCKPCKSELPLLSSWYRKLRAHGFTVVGVDQAEGISDVAAFVQRLHVPYPIALDSDGTVANRYNVSGTPTTLLLDRRGVVVDVHLGALSDSYLATHVAPLVKGA